MSVLPVINFSHDWNHKLQCNVYTTLRPWNEAKYMPGRIYEITLCGKPIHRAELHKAVRFELDKLPEVTAMLDTGYTLAETKAIIYKMYKGSVSEFGLYVLRVIERYNSPGNAGERPGPRPDAVQAKGDVEGGGGTRKESWEPSPLPLRLREGKGTEVFNELAYEVAMALQHQLIADGDDPKRIRLTNQRVFVACQACNSNLTAQDLPAMLSAINRARMTVLRRFEEAKPALRRKLPDIFAN